MTGTVEISSRLAAELTRLFLDVPVCYDTVMLEDALVEEDLQRYAMVVRLLPRIGLQYALLAPGSGGACTLACDEAFAT